MTKFAQAHTKTVGFLTVLAISTVSMLWLFWHYPVSTAMATLVILAGLGVSARLARFIQGEARSDLTHR